MTKVEPVHMPAWLESLDILNESAMKRLRAALTKRIRDKKGDMAAKGQLGFGPAWQEMHGWYRHEFTLRGAAIFSNAVRVLSATTESWDLNDALKLVRQRCDEEFSSLYLEAQELFKGRQQTPAWYMPKLKEALDDAKNEAIQLLQVDLMSARKNRDDVVPVPRSRIVLSLVETQYLNRLADLLYGFLPGKPHPYADPRISFKGIAGDLGLGSLWIDGGKLPAITELLSETYIRDQGRFATLVLEVVRRGISYREVKKPVKRQEIEAVNEVLLKLKLRIKDLGDPGFLDTLPGKTRRKQSQEPPQPQNGLGPVDLSPLRAKLKALTNLEPCRRGFAFESLLTDLFASVGLAPRGSFRLIGEQIDGSFHHAGQTYLVEAKWHGQRLGQSDLLVFSGKVGGKAQWTRGVFISLSGYTSEGLEAFARGKQTNIICFDGLDLHAVLDNRVSLHDLIGMKARAAAESNAAFVSVRSLLPGVL